MFLSCRAAFLRPRSRRTCLVAALVAVGLALGGGCDAGPRAGSFTNWLSPCESQATCGASLECVSGYCVLPCSELEPCPEAARCLRVSEGEGAAVFEGRATPAVAGICAATCTTVEECQSPLLCRGGVCVPPCAADGDGDGWCNAHDTCPSRPDPEQLDADGDGVGDVCDPCPDVSDADQAPYPATPLVLPGRVELEHYDRGGECVAYHDADALHDGETLAGYGFRLEEAVDVHGDRVEQTGDLLVGFTHAGEWLEYTVTIPQAGIYDFELRYAKGNAAGTARLELDDRELGSFELLPTASFGVFTSAWLRDLELPARERAVLRLRFEADYANYTWLDGTLH